MSSAATAGPPPNHHPYHNASGGGRPVGVTNGLKHDGDLGKRPGKVFKHIQDLINARPDYDINAPIRTILLKGEAHAKGAESYFDFRRPDLALEEFIRASIIAVEVIPRHKDYPQLQSDRGELHRLYVGLKKRISTQQDRFDEAKIMIKENNAQNGTQPGIYTNPDNEGIETVRTQSNFFDKNVDKGRPQNDIAMSRENGLGNTISKATALSISQARSDSNPGIDKRPAIHPKPEALQGRIINHKATSSQTILQPTEDLTARFARLRGAENRSQAEGSPIKIAPIQDPRINTRPILVPPNSMPITHSSNNSSQSHSRSVSILPKPNRPLGPRDLPSAPSKPLKIALGVEIPEMPRPPEAVYSPARTLDNTSHITMQKPQTFNNTLLRTSSIDSARDVGRGFMNVDDSSPYFYSSPVANSATIKKPRLPDLSSLKSITAQQLQQYMQIGSQGLSILLVDIRNRELFDNGHIMWHSIICIEPISLRADDSADDLEQRLVISPDAEQRLYTQRQDFSLLVYYDQSTSSSSKPPLYRKDEALSIFHKAVCDYAYDKPLQNRPLLLEGGLDAWIDLIGEGALATSRSALLKRENPSNLTRTLPPARAAPQLGNGATASIAEEKRQQYSNKGNESREYLVNGSENQRDDITDDFYFKTADDFMRRFPAVSDIKESMMSPSSQLILASQNPALPEPAVTPGSYSHMFSRLPSGTQSATDHPNLWGDGHIGLYNRGNMCYMLAAIQAVSSVHEIRDYLFRGAWLKNLKPSQDHTNMNEQQLITRTFSNLLMHLWSKDAKDCDYINPRTFVGTVNRLHLHELRGRRTSDVFGGSNQHDSQEFLNFLIENLCNETSPPKPSKRLLSAADEDAHEKWLDEQQDISVASKRAYQLLQPDIRSPIEKLTDSCFIKDHQCKSCFKKIRIIDRDFSHFTLANFPDNQDDRSTVTLDRLLLEKRSEETLSDYKCRYCSQTTVRQIGTYYLNFPDVMLIHIARGKTSLVNQVSVQSKITAHVSFPENGLDLTQFQVPGSGERDIKYDCFAVICHIGSDVRSGHYTTYRRDMVKGQYQQGWWLYDDTRLSPHFFRDIPTDKAYVLFYRRQGTGMSPR